MSLTTSAIPLKKDVLPSNLAASSANSPYASASSLAFPAWLASISALCLSFFKADWDKISACACKFLAWFSNLFCSLTAFTVPLEDFFISSWIPANLFADVATLARFLPTSAKASAIALASWLACFRFLAASWAAML